MPFQKKIEVNERVTTVLQTSKCKFEFVLAGHDTTASAISWSLYRMAANPDYQQKARQEVENLLHDRDSDDILW